MHLRAAHATSCGTAARYRVTADVRTGPSRNFAAPDGTVAAHVHVPGEVDEVGRRAHRRATRTTTCSSATASGPRVLVTDPNTAGVYDTVYVDLDGDHDFSDEKPVTKASPASYRDIDHDGFVDASGGLLYYISDGADGSPVPGGLQELFGDQRDRATSGAILAWTGDFDPGIDGHGTLTASNVVGQGVDQRPRCRASATCRATARPPAAVVGGAPDAKLVPFGDIYFAFEASTQLGYILGFGAGVDVLSNSYGDDDVDNDGFDAASQEADLWNNAFGNAALSLFSTGNGAPGFGTTNPPSPSTGMSVGASTQFSGTGWDSIKDYSQVVDNDVIVVVEPRPGRHRHRRRRHRRRRRATRPATSTLNSVGDGRDRVGDVGRHEPLDAGRRRRRGARLPGVARGRRGDVAERVRRPLDADVERART